MARTAGTQSETRRRVRSGGGRDVFCMTRRMIGANCETSRRRVQYIVRTPRMHFVTANVGAVGTGEAQSVTASVNTTDEHIMCKSGPARNLFHGSRQDVDNNIPTTHNLRMFKGRLETNHTSRMISFSIPSKDEKNPCTIHASQTKPRQRNMILEKCTTESY